MTTAMADSVTTLDGIKKQVTADLDAAKTADAISRWAAGAEALTRAMSSFARKNPDIVAGTREPTPALVEGMARLDKAQLEYVATAQTLGGLLLKHRASPEVQKALEKLKTSLAAMKAVRPDNLKRKAPGE